MPIVIPDLFPILARVIIVDDAVRVFVELIRFFEFLKIVIREHASIDTNLYVRGKRLPASSLNCDRKPSGRVDDL